MSIEPAAGERRILLARHATPDWTRTDIPYDRPPGPPLVRDGELEAAQLGDFLGKQGVRRLYHSPMERTRHTASIAAEIMGVKAIQEELLLEWRGDEEAGDVRARMLDAWQKIEDEAAHGPVAIVGHGGPIRVLLEHLGMSEKELRPYRDRYDHRNPLPPAGSWRARRAARDLTWQLDLAFEPSVDDVVRA